MLQTATNKNKRFIFFFFFFFLVAAAVLDGTFGYCVTMKTSCKLQMYKITFNHTTFGRVGSGR